MRIDWLDKLRNDLQLLAFCLAMSPVQFAFSTDRPYEIPLVYSVAIGSGTWAMLDFERHLFPSSRETGWPLGRRRQQHPNGAGRGGAVFRLAPGSRLLRGLLNPSAPSVRMEDSSPAGLLSTTQQKEPDPC